MSLSRYGEDGKWFDVNPGYVYITEDNTFGGEKFNVKIRSPDHFCELAMRALDQSGELDEETLQECREALISRFGFSLDQ